MSECELLWKQDLHTELRISGRDYPGFRVGYKSNDYQAQRDKRRLEADTGEAKEKMDTKIDRCNHKLNGRD